MSCHKDDGKTVSRSVCTPKQVINVLLCCVDKSGCRKDRWQVIIW